MRLGIDWDEEDAAEQAARQEKASKTRNTATVAAEPAVANAVAPPTAAAPAAATPAAPSSTPGTPAKPPQSFAESIIHKTEPYWNPIHLKPGVKEFKSYEDVDPYATGAHAVGEFLSYWHGVRPVIGGIGTRINKSIAGIDPTIKAQIAATNATNESKEKIAAMKYGQPQGPDRTAVPTPEGRIEPTFDTTPLPDGPSPASPEAIATNSAKPNPLDLYAQQKHGVSLATLEQASGGPLTKQADIDIIANQFNKGQGITVNTLPGKISNQPPGIPGAANPMDQLTKQPPAPQLIQPKPPAGAPINAAPPAPPAAPTSVSDAVATGQNPTQALNESLAKDIDAATPKPAASVAPPELRTGTNKPAYAGQGPTAEIRTKGKKAGEPLLRNNYAKIEDVPAGYAFVPGAQHIDTSRTNIGQAEYTKAYTNRPFPVSNDMAVQESNDINRMLGRPTRAEAKAAGIALPPQTPGITKHVLESKGTPFMGTKAAKVGGVLGALIAIPDVVNAQTVGQRGMAGANLLEAVLPPGFTMSNAGEGSTLSPQQIQANQTGYENQFKLGSPFAQTQSAKDFRMSQKAGAGQGRRGVPPPNQR